MLNKIKLSVVFGIGGALLLLLFGVIGKQKAENLKLNNTLQNAQAQIKEMNVQVERQITKLTKAVQEKDRQLQELKDVQTIKNALTSAQNIIEQLNKELIQANDENAALREANLNVNNRLQGTTKEFMRVAEDLKFTRSQLSGLDKDLVSPLKKKIGDLEKEIAKKEKDLNSLKEELTQLQRDHSNLATVNRSLEKKVRVLEEDKVSLEKRLGDYQKIAVKQSAAVPGLEDNLNRLNVNLAQKDTQIKLLESNNNDLKMQLSRISEELTKKNQELNTQKQEALNLRHAVSSLEGRMPDLEKELESARQEILKAKEWSLQKSFLEESLKSAKEEIARQNATVSALSAAKEKLNLELNSANSLYENAKAQINKVSDILIKKEIEADKARKESADLKEKFTELQVKLADSERMLSDSGAGPAKIKELQEKILSLQPRLTEVQELLDKKTEMVQTLEKNLESLNHQLTKKEEEKKALENKLSQVTTLKDASQDELTRQKQNFEDVSVLYNNLKAQMAQISDLLTQKEIDLDQKRREISALNDEVANLRKRVASVENELTETKDRQKKTIDDLAQAVRLNSALQERIIGVSASLDASVPAAVAKEKKTAEELKKKVEVILEPDK